MAVTGAISGAELRKRQRRGADGYAAFYRPEHGNDNARTGRARLEAELAALRAQLHGLEAAQTYIESRPLSRSAEKDEYRERVAALRARIGQIEAETAARKKEETAENAPLRLRIDE